MVWVSVDGKIVPRERSVELTRESDGKLEQKTSSIVRFPEFKIQPVDAREYTLAGLGIPVGVDVQDLVAGTRLNYFSGWGEDAKVGTTQHGSVSDLAK